MTDTTINRAIATATDAIVAFRRSDRRSPSAIFHLLRAQSALLVALGTYPRAQAREAFLALVSHQGAAATVVPAWYNTMQTILRHARGVGVKAHLLIPRAPAQQTARKEANA
jgi:hypothetical protein